MEDWPHILPAARNTFTIVLQVIGTLITEWGPGEKCCRNMFVDRTVAEFAAVQLAQIASYYKFEGWLINIENKVSPDNVPHLLHFLR